MSESPEQMALRIAQAKIRALIELADNRLADYTKAQAEIVAEHKVLMKWVDGATHVADELAAEKEKYRLLSAQHARLCDEVYEEDGETLKIVAERKAREALETAAAQAHPLVSDGEPSGASRKPGDPIPAPAAATDEQGRPMTYWGGMKDEALRLEGMAEAASLLDKPYPIGARAIRAEIGRRKVELSGNPGQLINL